MPDRDLLPEAIEKAMQLAGCARVVESLRSAIAHELALRDAVVEAGWSVVESAMNPGIPRIFVSTASINVMRAALLDRETRDR